MKQSKSTVSINKSQSEHIEKYPNLQKVYGFKHIKGVAYVSFEGPGREHRAKNFKQLINSLER